MTYIELLILYRQYPGENEKTDDDTTGELTSTEKDTLVTTIYSNNAFINSSF